MQKTSRELFSIHLNQSDILVGMTIDALILLAGGFVTILPFLGFPSQWDTALFVIAGISIIGLGITVRRRGLRPTRTNTLHTPGELHDTTQGE